MQRIRRDDTVFVTKGKDRGRTGQVRKVVLARNKTDKFGQAQPQQVIVTGINMVKRHLKPRGPQKPGGIVEREAPLSWANVALVCASCGRPARVGFRLQADGRKVRYCKRCDTNVD
jgi:large subunit ribosomal protein L24